MHHKRKSRLEKPVRRLRQVQGEVKGAWPRVVVKIPRGARSWERFCWPRWQGPGMDGVRG